VFVALALASGLILKTDLDQLAVLVWSKLETDAVSEQGKDKAGHVVSRDATAGDAALRGSVISVSYE
jgi:hypothetical protein